MNIENFVNRKLTKTGEMPNGDNIYWITQKSVNAIKEQLRIGGVGVTLPNIDELNIEVKKQIENIDEELVSETIAFRKGFVGCFMWFKNYLNKGN